MSHRVRLNPKLLFLTENDCVFLVKMTILDQKWQFQQEITVIFRECHDGMCGTARSPVIMDNHCQQTSKKMIQCDGENFEALPIFSSQFSDRTVILPGKIRYFEIKLQISKSKLQKMSQK